MKDLTPWTADLRRVAAKEIEQRVFEEYHLADYYAWKHWLLEQQQKSENNDYPENWLFYHTEDVSQKILETYPTPGETWYLIATTRRHKICGKTFTAYEVFPDKKKTYCVALCGFRYEEE